MIKIKPFRGVRPEDDIAHNFIEPSFDLTDYSQREFELEQIGNANFLQIIAPVKNYELPTKKRFDEVRRIYNSYKNRNILKKDIKPNLYIYRQISNSNSFTGVLTGISADNYFNGDIKTHESTIEKKEKNITKFINAVQFQAEPILLTYERNNKIQQLIYIETQRTPEMSFTTKSDNVKHSLWMVKSRLILHQFINAFKKIDKLYVADGHHRIASLASNVKVQRNLKKDWSADESFNFILSYLIPNNELVIHDYNRLITDLNGHSKEEFLRLINKSFTVKKKEKSLYVPTQKQHISMYLEGEFYALFLNHNLRSSNNLSILDAHQLEKAILKPILNINNARSNNRIGFVYGNSGTRGIELIKAKVDSKEFKVGFGMYPVGVKDLQYIADKGLKMPPKSTYVLPKIQGGLLIHELDD